ncbi:MAG: hypothetical protein HY781_03140 [Chloroflexi bacterium]|nr:hypothetical protein [Chloroflexota bacterium]
MNFSCSISLTSDNVGGCSSGETGCTSTEHTTSYPPATIAGSINCSQTGNDGWCVGTASLSLSANEPLGGYSITLIEGTRNGETFACIGASCNVPLVEGQNDFTFWALSSWGDSSLMGASCGKLDSQPPQVGLSGASSVCPDCGESLSVSLNISDATSGAASWTLTLDGAALSSGSGSTSQTVPVPTAGLSAGSHALTLSASDIAGNVNAATLTFSLLLPTPTLTPVPSSTPVPAQPGNPPADQSGSSNPFVLTTPTIVSTAIIPTQTAQPVYKPSTTPAVLLIPISNTLSEEPPAPSTPVLWGSTALAFIGSATAYTLSKRYNKTSNRKVNAYLELTAGILAIAGSVGVGMIAGKYANQQIYPSPIEPASIIYSGPFNHQFPCSDVYEEFCRRNIPIDLAGVERMLKNYGIRLTEVGNGSWALDTTEPIYFAANDMGSVFAEEIGGSPSRAFRDVYGLHDGRQFTFEWDAHCLECRSEKMIELCVDENQKPVFSGTRTYINDQGETVTIGCRPQGGYTHTENHIEFATLWPTKPDWRTFGVVHELSHAFALRWYDTDENGTSIYAQGGPYVSIPPKLYENNEGFYKPNDYTYYPWRQHPCNPPEDECSPSETFADMGLAYIYGNKFAGNEMGQKRASFNTEHMPGWIRAAVDR